MGKHVDRAAAILNKRALSGEIIFWSGLAALLALLLSLPVFPSGDGAVHVYYSHVLALLAAGHGGIYASVYAIRHLIQPYSLHYFWLIGAEHVASVAWAEKSFVAAILLTNAIGFRFLARQLGGSAASIAPWILPLLLSWPLGSGFFNFCFAAGMLFFALGLYVRALHALTARVIWLYIGVLFLLILSHPVPLLALILLLAGEVALRLVHLWRTGVSFRLRLFSADALCLSLALLAFIFPMLIANKASVANSLLRDVRPHVEQVQAIVSGDRLSMFFSGDVAGILFTAGLVALAPVGAVLLMRNGVFRRLRAGNACAADRLWGLAWLMLFATLIFPESMNGSALFADRMVPLLWPLLLVGVAAVPLSPTFTRWSLGLAALWTASSIVFAMLYLLPVAREQQALTHAPMPRDARGLFVTAPLVRRPFAAHLAGELLDWGGARAFESHGDVLLNSPWMQLTIMPLEENRRGGLLRDTLPGSVSENPATLDRLLLAHGNDSRRALAGASFLLYSDPASAASQLQLAAARLVPADWRCTATNSYAVCLRRTFR